MYPTTDTYHPGISRRGILKGLGATLTLPFLPSLAWAKGWDYDPSKPPRRWVTMLFTNGVHPDHWWAKGSGASMELSKSLKPLEKFKQDLLVIEGLRVKDDGQGFHVNNFTNWLNGSAEVNAKSGGKGLPQSIDIHMAKNLGHNTVMPSLHLGIEPPKSKTNGVMWSTISWTDNKVPVVPEIQPRMAFDALFDSAKLEREKSLLDLVQHQAKDVNRKLAYQDRQKMDQFLTSIREIEQRIDRAINDERPPGAWRPAMDKPGIDAPAPGIPTDVQAHQELMSDLLVLALQMDKTRIATMIFENDSSNISLTFIDGVTNGAFHGGISHHQSDAEMLRQYQLTNEYHVGLCARSLEKMAAVEEGNGTTLLDNTMVTFGSNMFDGNKHDSSRFPVILAGGRNCDIKGGRVLDLTGESVENRRLLNLHLATAQRMGSNLEAYGNSVFPLKGLS